MTVKEILEKISPNFSHLVWIGKNYSVADLMRDLKELDKE
jgi:hypothetical protein